MFGYGSFNEESIKNSANALFYFAIGLPAFSLIKVFSTFFFARHDTKNPFLISLISVFLNVFISITFFQKVGFLIIPIATTISSWFNAVYLYAILRKKKLFRFNLFFLNIFIIILFASFIMGIFFHYLTQFFQDDFSYDANLKALYLVGSVISGFGFYILMVIFIKAFKISDLKLKY